MTLARRSPRPLLRLALGLLAMVCLLPASASADYVLVTGATWNAPTFGGMILLPSGAFIDIEGEQLSLVTTDVTDADTLIFDLDLGSVRLDPDPPSALLDNDPFFMTFASESEVQTQLTPGGVFIAGPSDLAVDLPGAITWVGEIVAPPGAGGGGSSPMDTDGDGVPDSSDNCVSIPNASQTNIDGDSLGDACDPDDDNDGVLDGADNCQTTPNGAQTNTDGDALGDACDPDDDNDGLSDVLEIGTYGTNPLLADSDGDTFSDLEEVNAGTDPNDPASFPAPPIPALGIVGGVLLSALLMAFGMWMQRREARSPSD